jgi:hypothetical protein
LVEENGVPEKSTYPLQPIKLTAMI